MAREGSRRGKYKMRRLTVQQPVDVSIRHIPLSQGQVAIVDATDFWIIEGRTYVQLHIRRILQTSAAKARREFTKFQTGSG